jgi:hypothetical protein
MYDHALRQTACPLTARVKALVIVAWSRGQKDRQHSVRAYNRIVALVAGEERRPYIEDYRREGAPHVDPAASTQLDRS